jgi:hypothetical protein
MLARRLQDAWKVLWGRSEAQQEVLNIKAQWVEVQAQISTTFAKLNTWAARVAKQEQRALTEHIAAPEAAPPAQGFHPQPGDRKAALRRRVAEARGLTRGPVSLSSPPQAQDGDSP